MVSIWQWFNGPGLITTPAPDPPPETPPGSNCFVYHSGAWRKFTAYEWHSGAWVELESQVRYADSGAWET